MLCHVTTWLVGAGGARDVQSIISDYFGDQDPRVRTAALKAMVRPGADRCTVTDPITDPTTVYWFTRDDAC